MSSNKVAIVTGASSGIGKAISKYLTKQSYELLLIARDLDKLTKVKDEISLLNTEKKAVDIANIDICDFEKLTPRLTTFIEQHGGVDVLVNCAGYVKRGTSDLDRNEFLKMLDVNLIGTFNLINLCVPYMKTKKKGRIINVASHSGVVAKRYLGGYAASKFGVVGLSESLYKELAEYNIYVTAICPNLVSTEMTADVNLPISEMMDVKDVVKAVDFLMSLSNPVYIKEIVMQCRCKVLEEL